MFRETIGEFEELILLAVGILQEDAYGLNILNELEHQTGRNIMLSSIYKSLTRLEKKGFLTSYTGLPTPVRGGRKKRIYELTSLGKSAILNNHEVRNKMLQLIPGKIFNDQ